ncbi:MAG: hypothetical protein CFH44_00252 [Proteobacteria bacterium]|nr:MAG: hypothetical protein CFH44_00252 [Pseudomonadota bacterium]|tara:strand:+ start:700 stop:1098 length:399 start_codon:yes stop_codon:yes gene_type:complete
MNTILTILLIALFILKFLFNKKLLISKTNKIINQNKLDYIAKKDSFSKFQGQLVDIKNHYNRNALINKQIEFYERYMAFLKDNESDILFNIGLSLSPKSTILYQEYLDNKISQIKSKEILRKYRLLKHQLNI